MKRYRLFISIAVTCVLGTTAAVSLSGQEKTTKVTLLAYGSFLGYLDGLPEAPAGFWDKTPEGPSGGLVGVRRWLEEKDPKKAAIRLVTGNNLPRYGGADGIGSPLSESHLFWEQLKLTKPAAIAIGREDLSRALSDPGHVSDFVRLAASANLPFVSSNTFIIAKAGGLNQVESNHFRLEVPSDQSVGLVPRLTVACPRTCAGATSAVLTDLGLIGGARQALTAQPLSATVEADNRHWTLQLADAPLRPGHVYQLSVGNATFSFQTIRALTPRTGDLPVVREGTMAVTSFVSPDALTDILPSHREWKSGTPGAAACLAEKCELTVLSPSEAWSGLAPLLKEDLAKRLMVALTDLSDPDFRSLTLAAAGLRVLTVAPSSAVLGVAAPASTETSGDLGYNAVLNRAPSPQLTKGVMRPEWLGETIAQMDADLGFSPEAPELTNLNISVHFVEGVALRARLAGARIQYFVKSVEGHELNIGGAYLGYGEHDPAARLFGTVPIRNLWTDQNAMTAFLLDVVRSETKADVAVLDNNAVDDSVTAWLGDDLETTPRAAYLSAFILERAMFRPTRLVRVTVPAAGLAGFLEKLVAAGKTFEAAVSVSGIGNGRGPLARVDADTLRINGREVEAGHFYSVALPQRYAVALGEKILETPVEVEQLLKAADKILLGATLHSRMAARNTAVTLCVTNPKREPDCPPLVRDVYRHPSLPGFLADDLENRHRESARYTLNAASATFEVAGLSSKERGSTTFSSIPEDGRDGTPFRNIAVSLVGETGFTWQSGWSLTAPFSLEYAQNRVGRESIKETFPKNLWNVSIKLSRKVDWRPVHMQSLFATSGVQSNFKRLTTPPTTATREVQSGTDASGVRVLSTETIDLLSGSLPGPQRDIIVGGGITFKDIGAAKAPVRVTKITLAYNRIFRRRDLVMLTIAGQDITADQLAAETVQSIANKLFQADRTSLINDPNLRYGFGNTAHERLDAAATGKWTVRTTQLGETTVELDSKYRLYPNPPGDDRLIVPRHTAELRLKTTVPVWKRFQLVANGTGYWLWLRDSNAAFRILEYGLKIQVPIFVSDGPGHAHR